MKKAIAVLSALVLLLSLAACGREESPENRSSGQDTASVENETEHTQNTLPDTDAGLPAEDEADGSSAAPGEDEADGSSAVSREDDAEGHKSLVAYFSATGTTQGVAEALAEGIGADLYEIVPAEPYTADDLDYHDDNSRSTMEMNDSASRPEISGTVENMEQYDVVFLGYPIWWGEAPRIMSTFMESYDFSGKTIVPFCTSGGSGIGSSAAGLEELTSGAEWLLGQRFDGGSTSAEMAEWAGSLGL